MMTEPLISVVIITWNRKAEVLETVRSVYDQSYKNFEVIVVDNGSTDDTASALRTQYPAVNLLQLDQNEGVTARNLGIKVARGDVVFCLDSDASLDCSTLRNIIFRFEKSEEIGVINSKIVNASTQQPDQNAGWAYGEKQRAKIDQEFFCHNFSEGGCAIRKSVFTQTGLFWDKLFFGREGEEFSLRVLDAGFKILYYPQAVIYHRVSPDLRPFDPLRQYYDLRNSLYIYLVRYPWWLLLWFAPMKIATAILRGLHHGRIKWVSSAILDAIKETPKLLSDRRPIKNDTARAYLQYQSELGSLSWSLAGWIKYKM
jgi:GT2 family glycosyltransferase